MTLYVSFGSLIEPLLRSGVSLPLSLPRRDIPVWSPPFKGLNPTMSTLSMYNIIQCKLYVLLIATGLTVVQMCALFWLKLVQRGMYLQLCGDPHVTTLTHLRDCTAQEQYVVPHPSHSTPECVKSARKKDKDAGNISK